MSTDSFSKRYLQPLASIIGVSAWVALSVFVAPALLLLVLIAGLRSSGVDLSFMVNSAAGVLGLYGVQFVVGFGLMMILPVWIQKLGKVNLKKLLGIARGIKPIDIGYGLLAFGAYLLASMALQFLAIMFLEGYVPDETQSLGFSMDMSGFDLVLAAIGLVVLAPIFEELIFRGYLFSEVRRLVPFWLSALIVSLLFGVAHGQINVALDVFVLSLAMCVVREKTGSVWGTILMHMLKNGLAFTLLFIVKVG